MKSLLFAFGVVALVAGFAIADRADAGSCCRKPAAAPAKAQGTDAAAVVGCAHCGKHAKDAKTGCAHCAVDGNGHEYGAKDAKDGKDAKPKAGHCGGCAMCFAAVDEKPAAKDAPAAKEVKLEGTILCAKCALKQTAKCQTAIVVKEGGKEVTYLFADKGAGEDYHEKVCGGDKVAGTVIGKAFDKDGKKWITPAKVEYKK